MIIYYIMSNCNKKYCKCKNLKIKRKLFLQKKNITGDLLQLPTTNIEVDILKKQQYFTENSSGDIFTLKNLIVGSNKNIDTSNIYSKAISINRVSKSITQFYSAIKIVNTIVNFIQENEVSIRQTGFEKVLRPFAENNFFEDENYFWISTCLNTDNEEILNNRYIFSYKKYEKYSGVSINNLLDLYNEGKYIYFKDEYLKIMFIRKTISFKYFKLFEKIGFTQKNYHFDIEEWGNGGINLTLKCILNVQNILPGIPGVSQDYIVIASSIKLNEIIEDINEIRLFSPEYIRFITTLSDNMFKMHEIYNNLKKDIYTSNLKYDLWEYTTSNPLQSICIYSNEFPNYIGKMAVDSIIIGNTDINIPNKIAYAFNFNSKNLLLNNDKEIGVIQYSYNNIDYVILTKIITINNKKYLIINTNHINPFFNNAIQTNGDTNVEGSLYLDNTDGTNVLNLNTNTSVLNMNGRIAINTKNPEALLDIKSISTSEMRVITDQYSSLNNFIFSYFDFFIANFSNTNNRDWYFIYNTIIKKESISITTLQLPFDFKTATSSTPEFPTFINNFNNYIHFEYLEAKFKSLYEGKKASEITDPYFVKYFNELKRYFLIIWNQRDYYILSGYQTFTNIVNYLGGPVLRMHVMWHDSYYNVIRLFSSNLRLDSYLLNPQLNKILSEYYNSLFSCEQQTNLYSNLLKDPVIVKKQFEDKEYITSLVNNSYYKDKWGYPENYVFCAEFDDYNIDNIKYFFHERNKYWQNNQIAKLSVPNQDILVSSSVSQTYKYFIENFKEPLDIDRLIVSFYYWSFEYKVAYFKIIELIGPDGIKRKYRIGSGVDILNYISKNILSNGDQQFNGSLRLIQPSNNQTIINIDTTEKQVAIQYPLGLGTENPRSLLTIDDVSITNLFDYLDELSRKNRYISDLSKKISDSDSEDYKSTIESYIDPFTGKVFNQDIANYFVLFEYFADTLLSDIYDSLTYKYHWNFTKWVGNTFKKILNDSNFDPINNTVKQLSKTGIDQFLLNDIFYDKISNIQLISFIWGKKCIIKKHFQKKNKFYFIFNGINFNEYFTRINTNKNLSNIIQAIQHIQTYLNNLYLDKNKLTPINNVPLQPYRETVKKESKLFKLWVIDFPTNVNDTRLYLAQDGNFPQNLENLKPTDTIYNMLYHYDTRNHGNLTYNEVILYYQKIINIRQKIKHYNSDNLQELDSNIVGYRTDEDYWVATWLYTNTLYSSSTISVCEINVDDYLNQSVQMIGDLQMAGNMTLMNPKEYLKYVRDKVPLSSLNPLISIYPEEEFVGIGSQKIFTQYVLNYKTIDLQTNNTFAKNHVVVSNPYYPNFVGERISDPSLSLTRDDSIKSSYSGLTVRRKTKVFTLEDIVKDGDGKFGIDISYEVEDKYEDAYEVAESGISIVGLKTFKNGLKYPVPKYFWNIVDDATDKNTIEKKKVMELDSEGRLTVSKIRLGKYDLESVNNSDGTQSLRWGNVILAIQ
jgi:hypothetical protein